MPKLYRALLPDWFVDIEAETEEEAQRKAADGIRATLAAEPLDHIIAWEVDTDCVRLPPTTGVKTWR